MKEVDTCAHEKLHICHAAQPLVAHTIVESWKIIMCTAKTTTKHEKWGFNAEKIFANKINVQLSESLMCDTSNCYWFSICSPAIVRGELAAGGNAF